MTTDLRLIPGSVTLLHSFTRLRGTETLLALVQRDQDDQPLLPTRCTGYRVIAAPDHTQTHYTQ